MDAFELSDIAAATPEGSGGGGGEESLANGSFESGLSNWTATGPFASNNTWPLNSGYPQNGLEGSYCAGSHNPETGTGTLTSAPFTISQPYLNFRVGGWHQYSGQGGFNQVRLEPAGGGTSLCRSNPTNTNDLVQKAWDVSALQGQSVRLVAQDDHTQGGYAWMSVDAFGLASAPATSPGAICGGGGGGNSLPLADSFDNNDASMYHPVEGSWYASNYRYVGSNLNSTQHFRSSRDSFTPNGDYHVETEFIYDQFNVWNEAHLYIHWQNPSNYIGIRTINRSGNWRVEKFQRLNGSWNEGVMLDFSGGMGTGQTYRLKLSAQGGDLFGYVDYGSGYQSPYPLNYFSPPSGTIALGVNSCQISFDNVHIWTGSPKEMEPIARVLPDRVVLTANFPNPFNPSTLIRYFLPTPQPVELTLYDLLGQPLRRLVQEEQPTGWHQVEWNGEDDRGRPVATGVYLYRLETDQRQQAQKMTLVR